MKSGLKLKDIGPTRGFKLTQVMKFIGTKKIGMLFNSKVRLIPSISIREFVLAY